MTLGHIRGIWIAKDPVLLVRSFWRALSPHMENASSDALASNLIYHHKEFLIQIPIAGGIWTKVSGDPPAVY